MRFDVSSYYGTNLNGLEDRKTNLTFDEARDFLHEKVSNGGVVEVACTTTGVRKIFTYDEYFDGFEGESPMMLSDFEQKKEPLTIKEAVDNFTSNLYLAVVDDTAYVCDTYRELDSDRDYGIWCSFPVSDLKAGKTNADLIPDIYADDNAQSFLYEHGISDELRKELYNHAYCEWADTLRKKGFAELADIIEDDCNVMKPDFQFKPMTDEKINRCRYENTYAIGCFLDKYYIDTEFGKIEKDALFVEEYGSKDEFILASSDECGFIKDMNVLADKLESIGQGLSEDIESVIFKAQTSKEMTFNGVYDFALEINYASGESSTYPVTDISPNNRAFLSDSINEFVGKENKMQTFSKDKTAINKNKGEVKE